MGRLTVSRRTTRRTRSRTSCASLTQQRSGSAGWRRPWACAIRQSGNQAIKQSSNQDWIALLVEKLTVGAVRALGLDARVPGIGTLGVGAPADVVLIDPEMEWTVEPELFASKGKNTPLAGRTLKGRVVTTIAGGKVVWRA